MSDRPRIGIFGGTFDPPHNTHLAIARAALTQANLDRVYFVVAGRPPHKRHETEASGEQRYEMVAAALRGEPQMEACRMEIDRDGPSYTIDTLAEFREQFPDAELYIILGYDSLADFPKWRDPEGILAAAKLLVAPRPEVPKDVPSMLEGRFEWLEFPEIPQSSTNVREQLEEGRRIGDQVPPAVARIIESEGLYHADTADHSQ